MPDLSTLIHPTSVPALPDHVLVLDADTLGPLARRAADELLQEGESSNTRASYRAALRYWAAWYALRYRQPLALPVAPATVMQFVVDHVERRTDDGMRAELPNALDAALVGAGFKGRLGVPALSTVMHRVAVLSKVHSLQGQANPCRDAGVRELLSRTRRGHAKRGALPQRKAALTREPLELLLATCDDSLRGIRDRALLLFAWSSGGRRRSEVTSATLDNTQRAGDHLWIYTLGQSKGNQAGTDRAENEKPIAGTAAVALEAWLAASGIRSGAIFRRIRRGDTVAEPLTPAAVRTIVKARCAMAGLTGDFSAHSLRSGFVTEAGRRNVSLGDTMAMTGHASVATVMRYFRAGAVVTGRAARLLDGDDA